MPRLVERLNGSICVRVRDQQIVGVISRDSEDADMSVSQDVGQRCQDPDDGQIELTHDLEGHPSRRARHVVWYPIRRTDDGQLVGCASYGDERSRAVSPIRCRLCRVQSCDSQFTRQPLEIHTRNVPDRSRLALPCGCRMVQAVNGKSLVAVDNDGVVSPK